MSQEINEDEIIETLENDGFIVQKNIKMGKWRADAIINSSHQGAIIVEVKNKISIPDVLSTASMTQHIPSNMISGMGTISTYYTPMSSVKNLASNNEIAIINWSEPEKARVYYKFLEKITSIESYAKKISKMNRLSIDNIIHLLLSHHVITKELAEELQKIWTIRNKIIHNQDVNIIEINNASELADQILKIIKY